MSIMYGDLKNCHKLHILPHIYHKCIAHLSHFEVECGKNYHKLKVKDLPPVLLKNTTSLC